MPYDDSNVRKMIRDQTEKQVGFSHSKNVAESAKNLIHAILQSDVNKRYSKKHVQFKGFHCDNSYKNTKVW
mgnify:CR=1 FL=1